MLILPVQKALIYIKSPVARRKTWDYVTLTQLIKCVPNGPVGSPEGLGSAKTEL